MTEMTITRAQFEACQRLAARAGGRFVLNEGVRIIDEPPEGVVKLAREIVTRAPPLPTSCHRNDLVDGAIAAIMHARKALDLH